MKTTITGMIIDDIYGGRNYTVPTEEEERELARRWKDEGDIEARNELWARNIPYAIHLASAYHRKYRKNYPLLSFDDTVSAAMEGLGKALNRFDPSMGRLTTYTRQWIERYMYQECTMATSIRLPAYVWELMRERRDVVTPIKPGQSKCLAAANRVLATSSLHENSEFNPADEVDEGREELLRRLEELSRAFPRLRRKDRDVIERYFGLNGRAKESLAKIGERLGCTKQRAQQAKDEAISRLTTLIQSREHVA